MCAAGEQERLFEQLSQIINAAISAQGKQRRGVIRQLVCKVQEIQTTLLKHLAKEEEQLFPLLLQHFTYGEQVCYPFCTTPGFCTTSEKDLIDSNACSSSCYKKIYTLMTGMCLVCCAGSAGCTAAVLHPTDICGTSHVLADFCNAAERARRPAAPGLHTCTLMFVPIMPCSLLAIMVVTPDPSANLAWM